MPLKFYFCLNPEGQGWLAPALCGWVPRWMASHGPVTTEPLCLTAQDSGLQVESPLKMQFLVQIKMRHRKSWHLEYRYGIHLVSLHRFSGSCYVLVRICRRWGEKRDLTSLFCCWGCMAGSEPASSDEYSLNEWLLKCQVLCSARCLTSHVSFNLPQTRKPGPPLNKWRDGCLEELSYRGQAQAPFVQLSWNLNLHLYSLSTSALLRMLYFFFFFFGSIGYLLQWARLFFFFFSSCDAQA